MFDFSKNHRLFEKSYAIIEKRSGVELGKTFDIRKCLTRLFFLLLAFYILIGLTPVKAAEIEPATEIKIPEIELSSGVALLNMENGKLSTPDELVGSFSRAENKTFLVGHSVGVFKNLDLLEVGDVITYDLVNYTIVDMKLLAKSEIVMDELLSPASVDTIVLMTCAGELTDNGDATHRLIITAEAW